MDFIISLLRVKEYSSVLVFMDNFFIHTNSIPTSKECPIEKSTEFFVKYIVKYWGMLKNIIRDRDARFTDKIWKKVFKPLVSNLLFSTSFYLQTDG